MASPIGDQGAVTIHQDARIYDCRLEKGKSLRHELKSARGVWVQVNQGELALNGERLKKGDGASATEEASLQFSTGKEAEFLLFDLV